MLLAGRVVPYLLVSGPYTFLYMFIPNTRVRLVPALIGGLVAGVLWAIMGAIFTSFVSYSARLTLVYASFAILITALIWIYIAWLILLIGAQLSFYVQNPQYLRSGQRAMRLTASLSERLALNAMYLIGKRFKAGEPGWILNDLSMRLDVPSALVATVIRSLEGAGLLVATEDDRLLPGRDLSEINLKHIVTAARDYYRGEPSVKVHSVPVVEKLSGQIDAALRDRLEGVTLRELVEKG